MTLGIIRTIAVSVFKESVRDKVLYNLVFFAVLLIAVSYLLSQLTAGQDMKVIKDLGLAAMSLFGLFIAVFIGIGLVSKEIERKTLYTVLARPVRRWEFIVGKFFGLAGTLVVNTVLMAVGVFAALLYVSHQVTGADVPVLAALYLIVLQLVVMTALALFFSSFSSPVLSASISLVPSKGSPSMSAAAVSTVSTC